MIGHPTDALSIVSLLLVAGLFAQHEQGAAPESSVTMRRPSFNRLRPLCLPQGGAHRGLAPRRRAGTGRQRSFPCAALEWFIRC